MKNKEGTMFEADVMINGQPLNFSQSMTLRVALSSFLMCAINEPELGSIGPAYAARVREILELIHGKQK